MTLRTSLCPPIRTLGLSALAISAIIIFSQEVNAQVPAAAASPADRWHYADLADVFAPAPIAARIRVAEAITVAAPEVPASAIRFYVEADVVTLIRAPGALPPRLSFLVDVPRDARGRPLRLRKADMLIAAASAPGRPGMVRLATRDAMQPWSPALEARIRALAQALASPDAVPAVASISGAFHSPGTVPGEGETQIFLVARTGSAMSISVLRRPGEAPRWSFAPGEIIDEAAGVPQRDTLAWYRLACFLPRMLPVAATAELAPGDATAANADYSFVRNALGACPRLRPSS